MTPMTSGDSRVVDLSDVIDMPEVQSLFNQTAEPLGRLIADHRARPRTRLALGLATGQELHAAVLARTPHLGICEILAVGAADSDELELLVDAAAIQLHAVAVWAVVAPENRALWEQCGFSVREHPSRTGALQAERRHPPEPEGFRTSPTIRPLGDRHVEVELPPEGNTLPLVPEALRDHELPPHVLRWILDADEVGLLLQHLAPSVFPPVTPAVRPDSIRPALGSLAPVLGDPGLDGLAPSDLVPGLPEGLLVPVQIVELLAAADRIRNWLVEARRVRAWAEGEGRGTDAWIVHAPWEPHEDMVPELDEPRPHVGEEP